MRKIIFCDIDGCLNHGKNIPLDLDVLTRIKAMVPRLAVRGVGFTLCTGRPQPYAEAIAQILAVDLPIICEGGALLYYPDADHYRPMAPPGSRADIDALRAALEVSGLLTDEMFFEIGKSISLCVTGPHFARLDHDGIRAEMERFKATYTDYDVSWTHSTTSIDITPAGISKASGLRAVCADFGLAESDAIGIGDSNGDLSMLSVAGQAYCPSNASSEVRNLAGYVSQLGYAEGTLDVLKTIEMQSDPA